MKRNCYVLIERKNNNEKELLQKKGITMAIVT